MDLIITILPVVTKDLPISPIRINMKTRDYIGKQTDRYSIATSTHNKYFKYSDVTKSGLQNKKI